MKLIHYGVKGIANVYSVDPVHDHRMDKPCGLWVSVKGDNDWAEWCLSEDFGNLDVATEVVLSPDARMLIVSNEAELLALTAEYGVPPPWGTDDNDKGFGLDWRRMAQQYQGIIIAPYVWECRLLPGTHWYYCWDCASGCIWDASAVQSLVPLPDEGITEEHREQIKRSRSAA